MPCDSVIGVNGRSYHFIRSALLKHFPYVGEVAHRRNITFFASQTPWQTLTAPLARLEKQDDQFWLQICLDRLRYMKKSIANENNRVVAFDLTFAAINTELRHYWREVEAHLQRLTNAREIHEASPLAAKALLQFAPELTGLFSIVCAAQSSEDTPLSGGLLTTLSELLLKSPSHVTSTIHLPQLFAALAKRKTAHIKQQLQALHRYGGSYGE